MSWTLFVRYVYEQTHSIAQHEMVHSCVTVMVDSVKHTTQVKQQHIKVNYLVLVDLSFWNVVCFVCDRLLVLRADHQPRAVFRKNAPEYETPISYFKV